MALLDRQSQIQMEEEFTEERIRGLEILSGHAYTSAGGYMSTAELLRKVTLTEGDMVLDVGCGLGGAAIQMAKYGAHVMGVDLSSRMISKARDYLIGEEDEVRSKISFQLCDITRKEFLPLSFDFIYCRDTLIHLMDKETLMTKFIHWLKPGGKIMISEFCDGGKEGISNGTQPWMNSAHFHLSSIQTMENIMAKVGLQVIESKDRTLDLLVYLKQELARIQLGRIQILNNMGLFSTKLGDEALLDAMSSELKSKISSCLNGDTTWGFFLGRKL